MIRSLRWRLQLWHALLLTTVLIIFGVVVYALQWRTRLQQADAELDRVASVLTSRLRGLFPVPRMPSGSPGQWPRNQGGRGPNSRPPSEGSTEEIPSLIADALYPANVRPGRGGGPGRGDGQDDSPGRRENRGPGRNGQREGNTEIARDGIRGGNPPPPPREGNREGSTEPGRENPWFSPPPGLGLPDEFKHLFEGEGENSFYFIIWDRNGTVLEKSKAVGDIPFPDLHTLTDGLPVRSVRMRDMLREVVHVSRFDINVLVGRSLQPDVAALHRSGLLLILTGFGVLAIGLAGGWWFSSRAIRPIREMSATAESISVKNLSTRINVASTAAELEQLAIVLNRTFDRLQASFERQGQFTADASHELRTPLSVILSHAELALSRPRSSEEYQKAFQACRRASLRMKSLIDALLMLARFDSGHPEIERRPVELDRLVREAAELLQPLAEERLLTIHCHGDAIVIDADHDRLFQLVTNLLTNAIRYNKPNGRVDVDVTADEDFATIRVSDTGVGISADDLPRIFDRFYRVDKARSTAEGGCGLGLAICQTIVDLHQGTITANSELGVGTSIEVKLPLQKHVAASDSTASDTVPVAVGNG